MIKKQVELKYGMKDGEKCSKKKGLLTLFLGQNVGKLQKEKTSLFSPHAGLSNGYKGKMECWVTAENGKSAGPFSEGG